MVIRVWRGRAAATNRTAYPLHFRSNVLPELKNIKGFMGASLMQREDREEVEFVVLTKWASLEAVRAFAPDDISKAVVEPQAVAALISFDRLVQHYEVLEDAACD
jgi:heme-degrading monooxygenase HmoA